MALSDGIKKYRKHTVVRNPMRSPETDYRAVVPRENLVWADTLWGLNVFLPQSPNYYDPLTDSYEDNSSVPLLADMVESLDVSETVTFLSVGTLTPIAKMFDILSAERLASVLSKVDGLVVMVRNTPIFSLSRPIPARASQRVSFRSEQ